MLNCIEVVTIKEKINKENVLIHVIQVDSCPFPYSLRIGWTKLYIVRHKNIGYSIVYKNIG